MQASPSPAFGAELQSGRFPFLMGLWAQPLLRNSLMPAPPCLPTSVVGEDSQGKQGRVRESVILGPVSTPIDILSFKKKLNRSPLKAREAEGSSLSTPHKVMEAGKGWAKS